LPVARVSHRVFKASTTTELSLFKEQTCTATRDGDEHVIVLFSYFNPTIIMSGSMLTLNCLVFGEDEGRIFPVEIRNDKSVGSLKQAIKENKKAAFGSVDADTLDLWNVSIPYDDSFEENLKNIDLSKKRPLSPRQKLSTHFNVEFRDDCLAIVVRAPSGEWKPLLPEKLSDFSSL